MTDVELRLLGGFEMRLEGEVVELQPAMQRLLAFVSLAPRGVERCFAAFQLWPDKNEDRAKANLRSTLWRLGKLPADVVSATKNRLRLSSNIWVDAHHGIQGLMEGTDTAILDEMLPFHTLQSELLPDWYDDWLIVERERLRQLSLRALESKARQALTVGDTSDAIQVGLAAVAIDPLRESGHRIVIEAHLAEGNESEAVRELSRYRDILAAQPGLRPSPEIISLVDEHRVAV